MPKASALPSVSRFGFPLLSWGLAFHSLAMALLFGVLKVDENTVRVMASWKEMLLFILIIAVIARAATGRGPRVTLTWTDYWLAGLMTLALLFLITENLWFGLDLPRSAELLGIRDAVYFMLLYFVGRGTPELTEGRAQRVLIALILVTAVIGIAEWLFVSPEMLVGLGIASYFQDFLGASSITVGNDYGLPLNYWASIGGKAVRRAGSVYLGGQGFAVPFLLFFPIMTSWIVMRSKRTLPQIICYVLACTALLLTLTRMTIVIAVIQLVLLLTLRKRPEWAVSGLTVAAIGFVAALVLLPGFPTFVWDTLSLQESSSMSHATDITDGLGVMLQRPLGSGLGTADLSATRSGLPHLTGDNLFLKYGVELGALGLSLLLAVLGSILPKARMLYKYGLTTAERRMGITIWLATIGILINGMTAVVFNSITLGWLYFWLAGSVVTRAQQVAGEAEEPQRTFELQAVA